jgi:hypothetical protein
VKRFLMGAVMAFALVLPATASANGGGHTGQPKVDFCHWTPAGYQYIETGNPNLVVGHAGHAKDINDVNDSCPDGDFPNPEPIPGRDGVDGSPGADGADGATGNTGATGAPGVTTTIVINRVIGPKKCISRRTMTVLLPGRFKSGQRIKVQVGGDLLRMTVRKGKVKVSLVGKRCGVYAVSFRRKGVAKFTRLYTAGPNGNVTAYNVPPPKR